MKTWLRFWRDDAGGMSILGVILLYTIVVLGVTVGLITLRNQIVQEFGDVAVALDSLDQSWQAGEAGYDDDGPVLTDPVDAEPAGISVQEDPLEEGNWPPPGWTPAWP